MKAIKKAGLSIKAGVKAGGFHANHSRLMTGLRVTSGVKAGAGIYKRNHNTRLIAA
jgi:hypothetical protein